MKWSQEQGKSAYLIRRITFVFAAVVLLSLHGTPPDKLGQCTLAMVRPEFTADGRAILWKNRDVSNPRQAIHTGGGDGMLHYVGIGYAGDGSRVYGGVNEFGFAIANSNSYNIGNGNPNSDFDDGDLQTYALKKCATLEQLRELLDSTNTLNGGRTQPSNFFAFDSTGAMSIFEAGRANWIEYQVTMTDRFAVRANYSNSGTIPTTSEWGVYRHDRAEFLLDNLLSNGHIHFDSMFSIARDVAPEGWNGAQFLYSPVGDTISLSRTVCRYLTVSSIVIQGGKHTANGWVPPVCWFFLGKPFSTIAVPVWPTQNTISPLLTDQVTTTAPLCDRSRRLFTTSMINSTLIESSRLNRLLSTICESEQYIVRKTKTWMEQPITPATATAISDSMASVAYNALYQLQPDEIMPMPVSIPTTYTLSNPAPNPFNPVTTIRYSLHQPSDVHLTVYNALGQDIGRYSYGAQTAGEHAIQWSGLNHPSGAVYFKIAIGDKTEWRKGLLLK